MPVPLPGHLKTLVWDFVNGSMRHASHINVTCK